MLNIVKGSYCGVKCFVLDKDEWDRKLIVPEKNKALVFKHLLRALDNGEKVEKNFRAEDLYNDTNKEIRSNLFKALTCLEESTVE